MSFYGLSIGADSPLLACQWGNENHPGYHKCDRCPDYLQCPNPAHIKPFGEIPADCPRTGCLNCPRPLLGTCHFFD